MKEKAIKFLLENIDGDWCLQVYTYMFNNHLPMNVADSKMSYTIMDLLEEFGEDNDLPEGWWYEIGDDCDWFELILDNLE